MFGHGKTCPFKSIPCRPEGDCHGRRFPTTSCAAEAAIVEGAQVIIVQVTRKRSIKRSANYRRIVRAMLLISGQSRTLKISLKTKVNSTI